MNRRSSVLAGLNAVALLVGAPLSVSQEQPKPPMHMHKLDMDHRGDKDIASEYKSEVMQLREKANSHRKLAQLYRQRPPAKGGASYENVARHCDKLAQYYESAAQEAESVASELNK